MTIRGVATEETRRTAASPEEPRLRLADLAVCPPSDNEATDFSVEWQLVVEVERQG